MRLPHLPGLISMEQKGSVAAIVSPAGGIRSTGRVLGQQAREGRHKEVGQGTGHGGGRGQLRLFPRVCKMFTFCCILFTGRQGKVKVSEGRRRGCGAGARVYGR